MAVFSLLVFTASWCPPCEGIADLVAQAAHGLGVTVETVDIDANVERAEHYRVNAVPTYLRLRGTTEDGRLEGIPSVRSLREFMLGGERGRPSLPG